MRKSFSRAALEILKQDAKVSVLLGDIGVFGFKDSFEEFPERVFNIGILESATIGLAAGMAKSGIIPVVHTIAPFLVERAFEQLKIDFAYQKIGGNFVSVGASYDYAALGCTHHCPGDVGLMLNIPGMEIVVPGTADEFSSLFKAGYANGNPTYFRLSEVSNSETNQVEFGKAKVLKKGALATVIAVGPTLDKVMEATRGLDVTVLYYTTLWPFDGQTLLANLTEANRIAVVEPFYAGSIFPLIVDVLGSRKISILSVGVPREFLRNYGKASQHDEAIGLTKEKIRIKIEGFINGA